MSYFQFTFLGGEVVFEKHKGRETGKTKSSYLVFQKIIWLEK